MRVAAIVAIGLALLGESHAADRPTAEQVFQAVKESRDEQAAKYPPPTRRQAIEEIERQIRMVNVDLRKARGDERTELKGHLAELKEQLSQTKKDYRPTPRLAAMKWGAMPVGSVGYVGAHGARGWIHVHQVVSKEEFLGEYEFDAAPLGDPPDVHRCGMCLFRGIDTAAVNEGKRFDVEFNGVVTGRYEYESVSGASRTVPVVEKFDPDGRFK